MLAEEKKEKEKKAGRDTVSYVVEGIPSRN